MTNTELLTKFENLVANERHATRLVLEHISLIEDRKAYLAVGFDGMYSYLTKKLGYSDAAAYRRLSAARVLRANPDVADKVETGALNLTQLTTLSKLSRQTGIKASPELLKKLEHQPKAASEQILAAAFDIAPTIAPVQRTQRDHSVRPENINPAGEETARCKISSFRETAAARCLAPGFDSPRSVA